MSRRLLLILALLTSFAMLTAACGSDSEGSTATDDAGDADAVDTTDDPAVDPPADDEADAAMEDDQAHSPGDGPTITIGAQDFGESAILSEVYGQALAGAGYDVSQQSLGGFRDLVFSTLDSGDINFTVEYAASALEFLNDFAGEATGDINETTKLLQDQLSTRGLVALDPSPAVDSNSFVVTAETASGGLSKVSDLTADLRLGGPPDCPDNASCLPGLLETYGLDFSESFTPLDGGGPLTVAALDGNEIDVAILFSTDGVIADKGWVVLEDDEGLINADNIIPVMTEELATAYGEDLANLVNDVSAALDTAQLTELNRQFSIDKADADEIAKDWLNANGLLSGS